MDELQQLIAAVVSGDPDAMQQFQQLIQDPQQGPQIVQQVQQLAQQGDPGAQQLVQMLQSGQGQQQPMSAKLGGKLRTVKALNNICPEGYELKLYRAGGTICKKCMKKAEDGTKLEEKPAKNAAEEFKQNKAKTKKEVKPNTAAKKQLGGLITPKAVEKFKSLKQGGSLAKNNSLIRNSKVFLRTRSK
jgi:hypothetical protein